MVPKQKHETSLKGIPASPGIVIGPVFIYHEPSYEMELRSIKPENVNHEISRFQDALQASKEYLIKIFEETDKSLGQDFAEIIQIQISILEDHIFLNEVTSMIKQKHFDAAYATFKVFSSKKEQFLEISDEYLRDRAFDIQNLKRLILKNMLGQKLEVKLNEEAIIIADNINPADIIKLHNEKILGFCTNVGGKNSHTAIVARSLGVPAVVGTEYITNIVNQNDQLILDGNEGIIIVNPSQENINLYLKKQQNFLILEQNLLKNAQKPAQTVDGKRINVMANIEFLEELSQLKKSGAEGIGLYRTEGLFLGGNELPSEEYQTENYKQFAESVEPHPIVIRTLDIGGDKVLPELVGNPERNPFLGWRAIRFCLDHKEIFIPQLKAILRANVHNNIKLLLPMISSLEEIYQFKKILNEVKEILTKEGKNFNPKIDIGIMIEIPSAAIMAEHFAKEVEFFSIGTNDLIQYTLAVDRANEKISHLYNHFHPALLELIQYVIDVGKKTGVQVSMCGEMAGDPVAIPLLIGMGLESFSANHLVLPEIKNVIRNLSFKECQKLVTRVKKLNLASAVKKISETFYAEIFTVPTTVLKKNYNIINKE